MASTSPRPGKQEESCNFEKASANFWNANIFLFGVHWREPGLVVYDFFRTATGATLGRMIWVFRMGVIKRSWFPKRKELGVSIAHQYAVMGGPFEIFIVEEIVRLLATHTHVWVWKGRREEIGPVKLASWFLSVYR